MYMIFRLPFHSDRYHNLRNNCKFDSGMESSIKWPPSSPSTSLTEDDNAAVSYQHVIISLLILLLLFIQAQILLTMMITHSQNDPLMGFYHLGNFRSNNPFSPSTM